jgi:hypothetical protein
MQNRKSMGMFFYVPINENIRINDDTGAGFHFVEGHCSY